MYLPLFRVGSGANKLLSLYIKSLFLVTGLLPPASCSADDRPCVELPSWTSQTSTSSSTTTTWTADMLYGIDAGTTGRSTMDLDYGRSTEYNPYDKKADDPMSPISRRLQGGNASKLHELVTTLSAVCCLATLAFMMPAMNDGAGQGGSYRIPPAWDPANERTNSFRSWTNRMVCWTILTDLNPAQQCAATVMRLGGAARTLAEVLTPREIMSGGEVNGVRLNPLAYLMHGLQRRFSQLGDETPTAAMMEMINFRRHSH